ncbi:MAG: CsoR family transcriptional regulator, copper-sensing transcriptional repressor [Clostridia bacterium]|nr:CsoR family transcriptional regulator, copper-sensing transcriptional repressor [Clostridia bacterium]
MSEITNNKLLQRLNRIEGQVGGIKKMLENDRYCVDIIHQINAAQAGLEKVKKLILDRHIRGCVTRGIKNGDDSIVEELLEVIERSFK